MAMLDSSIVLVALPSIDADLAFPAGDLQWVMSAYLLSFGGLLLLGGRTADLLGPARVHRRHRPVRARVARRRPGRHRGMLLAARALQGVAAAIMTPTAMSILMTTFPEGAERNRALGVWTATGAIGGTAGWLVGGPITDGLGWEWIFFLNVPVASARRRAEPAAPAREPRRAAERRFDAAGAFDDHRRAGGARLRGRPGAGGRLGSGQTLGLLALAAILIAAFAGVESRSAAPLAPLRVFRSRSLVGGNLVLFALGMLAFGVPFVLTQYAQEVLGWSPVQFGLASVVMPVAAVAGTAIARRRSPPGAASAGRGRRDGAHRPRQPRAHPGVGRRQLPRRPLLRASCCSARASAPPTSPGSIASLTGVAETEAGLASGLSNASFQIGGAVGVAILSTVAVSGAHGGARCPRSPTAISRRSPWRSRSRRSAPGRRRLLLGARREPELVTEPAVA